MTDPREIASAQQFADWLASSPGGDSIVYHRGFLARDTASGQDAGLMALAHDVWDAAVKGQVYLTQGSLGEGQWAYIATAPAKRTKAPEGFTPDRADSVDHRGEYQKARLARLKSGRKQRFEPIRHA